jgi:murein DD-endopeptidase MepM/ murein hydrolase activator NlpD
MRIRATASRSRILGHAAIVAVIAVTAAGCSGSSRFSKPLFTGSTENQREIIGNSQTMPPPVANSEVTRSDLPPPGGAVATAEASSGQVGATLPPGAYEWTPEGVQPSGTVATTSSYSASAPAPQAAGGAHVVASGETVYSIGRLYGVRPNDIIAANALSQPGSIRVGQRLTIPGANTPMVAQAAPPQPAQQQVAAASAPTSGTLTAPAEPAPQTAKAEPRIIPGVPSIPVETKSDAIPASVTAAVDDAIEPPSADGTSFRWPVRGRIISGFGAKPNGQRNDGINLAVPEGTSVKAAEAGTVIYAGNELEGYGNLVLIRHADDWVSAYAHNSEIKVKKGDAVRRGQTVAVAGMSGSVTSPQVHFELRKKAKPVNPLDYLAGT